MLPAGQVSTAAKPFGPISHPRDKQLQAGCPQSAGVGNGVRSAHPRRGTVDEFGQLRHRTPGWHRGTCSVRGCNIHLPADASAPFPGKAERFWVPLPRRGGGRLSPGGGCPRAGALAGTAASACLGTVPSGEAAGGRCERGWRSGTRRSAPGTAAKPTGQRLSTALFVQRSLDSPSLHQLLARS